MSPMHAKSYPASNDIFLMPETTSSVSSQIDSLTNSVHQLDTSTPMLVTFDTSVKTSSINAPASPISKIDTTTFSIIKSPCVKCFTHKEQIEKLLEKQKETENQLSTLRKEYEEKCLSKSPDFMSRSGSISNSSLNESQDIKSRSSATLVNTNSNGPVLTDLSGLGYSSGIYNYNSNGNLNTESADWMKYWQSRPQTQPPK